MQNGQLDVATLERAVSWVRVVASVFSLGIATLVCGGFVLLSGGAPWYVRTFPVLLLAVFAASTVRTVRVAMRRPATAGWAPQPVSLPATFAASGTIATGLRRRTRFYTHFVVTSGPSPTRAYSRLLLVVEQGRATVSLAPGPSTWLLRRPPPVVFLPSATTHVAPLPSFAGLGEFRLRTGHEIPATLRVKDRAAALSALAAAGFDVARTEAAAPAFTD